MKSGQRVEIFITAGGKSTRMGQDKGMMEIADKPMLHHIMDMLRENHYSFTVIANDATYQNIDCRVVSDIIPDKGPMGALHTAFHYARSSHVLLLGCDNPFIPAVAIDRLIQHQKSLGITVAQTEGIIHPLQAVYPHTLNKKLVHYIADNQLKMQRMILQSVYYPVVMDDLVKLYPDGFINFNEPKDVFKWEKKTQIHR